MCEKTMLAKPATGDGYGSEQLGFVHRTCLYIATKLGDLLDEIVVVGGLIPPVEEGDAGGELRHFESDLAAIVTPGLELAFKDRRWVDLSGRIASGAWATRKIPVCGPGAFTVLKALAFGNRTENKDAYDLFYVWRGVGAADVAESLAPLQPDACIGEALSVIERDFCRHDGPGPVGTARFITRELDENIQADVVGYALALLRSMGR